MIEVASNSATDGKKIAIRYLGSEKRYTVSPYVVGSDFFDQPFIWGEIDKHRVLYKFLIKDIDDLATTNERFELSDPIEYNAYQEEVYATAPNINLKP